MIVRSTSPSLSMPLLCVALAGCGDAVATTDTLDPSTSQGSTTAEPTTEVTPTTSTTTGDETTDSGGMSASESTTTTSTTTTGPDTDTAVSATSTTSTSTTDTSTSTTSTSTTDTSTSTTDSTSTTTGGVEVPETCLSADFPVKAPLCGDSGPACTTLRDEVVSANMKFRNDMPAIALDGDCEPVVLYSEAVNGYHGFYGERLGPDMWVATPTPMVVATGSLASRSLAPPTALWRRFDGQWTQEGALAGMNHVRAHQLARDGVGALHVGHVDSDFAVQHEVFAGAWSKEQVITNAELHVRLALDAADGPHLTSWVTVDATWKLHYFAPPGVAEVVAPLGSSVIERQHHDLALVGAEATPWVLLTRKQADQLHHDIVLAHRTGPATWALETLASENSPADKLCDGPPPQAGVTCEFDYLTYYPLALAAGQDEVRALYVAIRRQGTMVSQCEQNPLPVCDWNTQAEERSSELRVAWPGSQQGEHQVGAADVFTDRAAARLDTAGQIHLAFYDDPIGVGLDRSVRYVMIGGE